jgi:hypothetical protein
MFTKSLQTGFIGLVLSVATAWAGPSAIQGVVKDAKGQAIKGADVRIESREGSKLFKTVKTDGNGRYVSDGLAAGVYRVTLLVNGAVKASITNTTTKADQRTQLNFDLKPTSASQASAAGKKGKHLVWVPSTTGSHIGGRWVEVDESGSADSGALNVKRGSAEALRREQLQATQGGLPASASGQRVGELSRPTPLTESGLRHLQSPLGLEIEQSVLVREYYRSPICVLLKVEFLELRALFPVGTNG